MNSKNYIDDVAQQEDSGMVTEPVAVGYHAIPRSSARYTSSVSERVSPSGDVWFDIPENYELALQAKANMGKGGKRYSHEELKQRLGL